MWKPMIFTASNLLIDKNTKIELKYDKTFNFSQEKIDKEYNIWKVSYSFFLGPHSKFMTDLSFVRNRNLQERREANVIKLLYQPIITQKTNAPKSIFESLASPLSQLMSVLGFLEFILSYRFSETISCLENFLILT